MAGDDELCGVCQEVDLYALYTGPRYYPGDGHSFRTHTELGTLQQIVSNNKCPLCRLVRHDLLGNRDSSYCWGLEDTSEPGPDLSKVLCMIIPIRADYHEELSYTSAATRDLLATKLEVRLRPVTDSACSKEEKDRISHHRRGAGIQLLSPNSVDPARPLLNGFRATTMDASFCLVREWLQTCRDCHEDTCRPKLTDESMDELRAALCKVSLIDVAERRLVQRDANTVNYAALSYVWGVNTTAYTKLADELEIRHDGSGNPATFLPAVLPKVVEDAILACQKLGIPYLWADLYCVDQHNAVQKASDIDSMGHIYRLSQITFVAGRDGCSYLEPDKKHNDSLGLLPPSMTDDLGQTQRIESIHGRRYITALPASVTVIHGSAWHMRSWTYQEGELASRIAFFGPHDILFMCGAGYWREALHSGEFGHTAIMPGISLGSRGYYTLSALNWLSTSEWKFSDYQDIMQGYTPRDLSFESDRLNAISGCLNIIAQKKGIEFLWGLPSADFHYALLWSGEYDRRRPGFPTWSWTAWHCLQIRTRIYPRRDGSGSLLKSHDAKMSFQATNLPDIELEGLLISLTESPHLENVCSQWLADITVSEARDTVTINSEGAHFFIDVLPAIRNKKRPRRGATGVFPHDFDTDGKHPAFWEQDGEYSTPFERLKLRDQCGNTHQHHYPYWYNHRPFMQLNLPLTLSGSTLAWLLRDGIDLIKVVEVKLLRGADGLEPFHHVLCLGIDRSQGVAGRGQRLGAFCVPAEFWQMASPSVMTIEMS